MISKKDVCKFYALFNRLPKPTRFSETDPSFFYFAPDCALAVMHGAIRLALNRWSLLARSVKNIIL